MLPEDTAKEHVHVTRVQQSETKTVALPIRMQAPSKAEFDAAAQAIAARAPNQAVANAVLDQLMTVPLPSYAPAFSGLFEDPDGLIWVQLSEQGAKRVELLAVRLDGTAVARVHVPMALRIYEIGHDYIVGSYSDADDATHVTVLKLTRR